jgi:Protease inhibitor Inh
MPVSRFAFGLALALGCLPAAALWAEELMPMDTASVDADLLKSMHGPWVIADQSGDKRCNIVLKDDPTIGGSVIDVDPGCATVFPVMADIAAWRLMESWAIYLVDAERNTRIRFTTPDEAYVADPETDGIYTILRPQL